MDRDRRLAELMGMCGWYCTKCDKPLRPAEVTYEENCLYCGLHLSDPDFSTPEWRAKLMDFCVDDELHKEGLFWMFVDWVWDKFVHDKGATGARMGDLISYLWRNLPTLIYQYDKENNNA